MTTARAFLQRAFARPQKHPFKHASPSQLALFGLCNLRWYFERILKFRTPEAAHLTLGKDVHAAIERYLLTGVAPDPKTRIGQIATPGLVFLPQRAHPEAVERKFAIYAPQWPVLVVGIADLLQPFAPVPTVTDHKTAKSFRLSAHAQREALGEDLQGVIYLLHLSAVLAGAPWQGTYADDRGNTYRVHSLHLPPAHVHLRFQWVQYSTDPSAPKAREITADVYGTQLHYHAGTITERLHAMVEAANADSEFDVEANPASCGVYGGCPFRNRCALTGRIPF